VQPGDWGYVIGRVHTGGNILADCPPSADPGQPPYCDVYWVVVGDGVSDLSENELEVWYSPGDRFAVQLKPPNSDQWTALLEPRQFIENQELEGGIFASIYNELYNPANGHNTISVYLSPLFSPQGVVGVRGGTWTVRLVARDVRDGRYDAWIERDDPRRLGKTGLREAWSFPSFFAERYNVDNSSVNSLACGNLVISVANLDPAAGRIHHTSSQGPTRDGRPKPEIAAPGVGILAACGFTPGKRWLGMTDTSMASPYVAGVIGRMLALDPQLTAAQIGGILRRTATPLPGGDYHWRDDAGFGAINPAACLAEVRRLRQREDRTP